MRAAICRCTGDKAATTLSGHVAGWSTRRAACCTIAGGGDTRLAGRQNQVQWTINWHPRDVTRRPRLAQAGKGSSEHRVCSDRVRPSPKHGAGTPRGTRRRQEHRKRPKSGEAQRKSAENARECQKQRQSCWRDAQHRQGCCTTWLIG